MKKLYKTRGEPRILYKKGIGVLLKITSGNIKKERLKLKELAKGNKQRSGALEDSTAAI